MLLSVSVRAGIEPFLGLKASCPGTEPTVVSQSSADAWFLMVFGMPNVSVTLPDGSARSVSEGATVRDVAEAISPRLASASIAGKIDGDFVDLDHVVADGAIQVDLYMLSKNDICRQDIAGTDDRPFADFNPF